MHSIKIGICQIPVIDDKTTNLKKAEAMINQAVSNNCEIVLLPEMFNCPYTTEHFLRYAEPIPQGPTSKLLSELARRSNIFLIGGSIPEIDEGGRIYNSSPVFDPTGKLIAKHRKIHLFDVDIPGKIRFKESDSLTPGNQVSLFKAGDACLGLAICYDVRFPELIRLMTDMGAQIILLPAAFNTTTGPAHWHTLLKARAVDNQVFIAAASPSPHPDSLYPAYGHSLVYDPWGNLIAEALEDEKVLVCELDLNLIDKIRAELPVLKHRRLDLYHRF